MSSPPSPDAPGSFKFIVPTVTADRRPIPEERRDAFIKALEGRSASVNGGFVRYESCRAGYRCADCTLVLEDVTVIETRGRNPFSDRELAAFAAALGLPRLYVEEAGVCRCFPTDCIPVERSALCRHLPEAREIVTVSKEPVGRRRRSRFVQRLFDPHWTPLFSTTISDTEIDHMICEGNRAIERMITQAWG